MTRDADDDATRTAGHARPLAAREPVLTILRWVHPVDGLVTVAIDAGAIVGRDASCATRLDTAEVSWITGPICGRFRRVAQG